MRRRWLHAIWVLLAGLQVARSQVHESLTIGAGDMLHVTIFREPELEQRARVKDSGVVVLDLVGQVHVAGLTAADAGEQLARLYESEHFLKHPQVSVLVEESVTARADVLGEVARPGTVPLTSPRSLLAVLSEAGGLTPAADRHVTIKHTGEPPSTVLVSNQPGKALGDADVLVHPGDTVLVPKAGIVYVLGDVGRPGGFPMQDDSRLSLLQALTLAAGTNKTAASNSARLLRKVNGVMEEQPLPLAAIERGKKPDLELQADDIVYVPFSLAKNVALGASSIVASASSAAVYAVQ
jgi:polysaccharide biosynthesis/export protein